LAVLRTLAADQRPATPDEQQQLAQYVGWGGLPQAFDRQNAEWANESASLAEALSEDDYARARRSTQDAHYTPLAVVRAIYAGLERLGFGGGRILEAGAGTGHFIGSLPDTMREQSRFTAIELDPTTAAVGQRLYPSATYINRGYEAVHIPNGHFDAVVGNPPFGQQTLYDPQHRELKDFSIHNYFIAKSIEALRPGGVLAVVVSRYFMDAANTTVREHIADRAHLLGAIRLPNTAFKENALTEVTTDVVFFQRCKEGETTNRRWIEVEPLIDYESNSEIPVNRYFVDHPRQMLGHMALVSGPHGERAELLPSRTGNLESDLAAALRILPENVYSAVKQELQADTAEEKPELTLPETLKVGSYFVTPDGKLARRLCDVLEKHDYAFVDPRNEKAGERIRGMVRVRDVLRELMRAELDDLPGGQILQLRDTLNRAYDVFVQRYGHLSSQANRLAMSEDPEYPLLFALERDYDKGITPETARKHGVQPRAPKATKAAIFQRRVLSPREEVTYVETAKDALVVSMNQRGRVDMDYVMRLCRQSEAEIVKELAGHIYRDPVKKEWLTADQYLSGNVKSKLAAATAAAATSAEYLGNVDALKAIQPADIDAIDIAVQLGSTWVPADDVKEFVRHLLGDVNMRLAYFDAIGRWDVHIREGDETTCRATWGTPRYPANDLIEAILQQKSIKVMDEIGRNENGSPILKLNAEHTTAANLKADEIRQAFLDWIWQDKGRRTRLARLYNDRFNTNVAPTYDGSHLTLGGASMSVSLRPHQKNAIWRGVQDGSALFDHVVGAGKTFAMIGTLMESKRMGLMNKPMLVVPNHLLLQWKDAFYELYPNANILVADKTDFAKQNRERLFAKIATNDWDAVIVAHSSFKRIGVPPATLEAILKEQINDLTVAIAQAKEEKGDRIGIKEMEKIKERMKERLKKAADTGTKDQALTFDELGVDAIAVDEAHLFKNLQITTSLSRVSGLGNLQGSEMAFDLFAKCRYLQMKQDGRGVFFATGTPISNTIAELYTMQRYMRYDDMRERKIAHFDAWASTFGQVVTGWELDATGVNYRLNSRFAKFQNVPELIASYRTYADVIAKADLDRQAAERGTRFPVPKLKTGRPINVVVERSKMQAWFMGEQQVQRDAAGEPMRRADGSIVKDWNRGSIIFRMEHLPDDPREDNPLKITNEARKAGLDFRLINPDAPDHADSKINACIERVLAIHRDWESRKGTQLIFCDLSTPKKGGKVDLAAALPADDDTAEEGQEEDVSMDEMLAGSGPFSVYDDIKAKLIQHGIPADQVRFIHDAKTDLQKAKLFDEMNRGEVRILLGSTAKMGAGTNVQRRLVALHHLDAPWRPSDLEQREGRGLRQGNAFYEADPDGFEFTIYRYATKQTYDSRMWQTIEFKAAGIEQFRRGDLLTRTIEDVAGEAANAAEMKAAATGNPLIFMQVKLTASLKEIEASYSNYQRTHYMLEHRIEWLSTGNQRADKAHQGWAAELAIRDAHPKDTAAFVLPNGRRIGPDDMKVLLEHLMTSMKAAIDRDVFHDKRPIDVGQYRGFGVSVYMDGARLAFVVKGEREHESDNLRYHREDKFNASGFLSRLDNFLASFEGHVAYAEQQRERDQQELERAKAEYGKPFAHMERLEALRADVRDIMAELQRIQADENYVSTWKPRSAGEAVPHVNPGQQPVPQAAPAPAMA